MIVVDTNVVSELMRPSPSPVVGWVRQSEHDLYTTSITLAGIGCGIERLADGRRKRLLRSTAEEVFADFAERVLAFDAEAALVYALHPTRHERQGWVGCGRRRPGRRTLWRRFGRPPWPAGPPTRRATVGYQVNT